MYVGLVRKFAARCAGVAEGGTGGGRRRISHRVSRNLFSNAVPVNEESASVIAEHRKEGGSNGLESAVKGGVRCCRMRFRVSIRRIKVDLVSTVNVAVHFPDSCIKPPFVLSLCTDQVSVYGLDDIVHSAKEIFFSFQVRGRPGCDQMVKVKRKGKSTENQLQRSSFCRPVHAVVVSVR